MAVNFYLEKRTDKSGDAPIRVSIQICGVRVLTFKMGFRQAACKTREQQRTRDHLQCNQFAPRVNRTGREFI